MCAQSNKDEAASHHDQITGTSLGEHCRTVQCRAFFSRSQQGLKVCGLVSHSVSLPFTSQVSVETLLEDIEEWQLWQIHHLTCQREAEPLIQWWMFTHKWTRFYGWVFTAVHTQRTFVSFFFSINISGVSSARVLAPGFSNTSKGFIAGPLSLLCRE